MIFVKLITNYTHITDLCKVLQFNKIMHPIRFFAIFSGSSFGGFKSEARESSSGLKSSRRYASTFPLHHRSALDPATAGKTSFFSLMLCLFVPVAALPTVAPNLSANSARISIETLGYASLCISAKSMISVRARTSHNVINIYQILSMSMFFDQVLSSFFPISWKK